MLKFEETTVKLETVKQQLNNYFVHNELRRSISQKCCIRFEI